MREEPTHARFRARMAFDSLGLDIHGPSERSPEAQAMWEARLAEYERDFGEAAMPKLLEEYERELAAYEQELAAARRVGSDQAVG